MRRISVVLLIGAAVLGGCQAFRPQVKLAYAAPPAAAGREAYAVAVTVTDERGTKAPALLGVYRSNFGNPHDLNTYDKVPLADLVKRDLEAELKSLGFGAAAPAARALTVAIREWHSDSLIDTRLAYDLRATVTDAAGKALAESRVKDELLLRGTAMAGASIVFERDYPQAYGKVIEALVRNNPAILAALRGR
jgi:hypothetical protein